MWGRGLKEVKMAELLKVTYIPIDRVRELVN